MAALTVLMPVYNGGAYLLDAVDSVLRQDFADFVLLLLDDGSTDDAIAAVEARGDARVVVSRSEGNLGLGATLTRGIEECATPYFVRMDADDLIPPSKFGKQMAFLLEHPAVGIVGTQFSYFGTSGGQVRSPTLPTAHADIFRALRAGNLAMVHGSLMGRIDVMRRSGGYRLRGMGEDWDMFLRVGEISELANLPEDLYSWRLHGANAQVKHLAEQQLGIRYACDCAERRAACQPELKLADFVAREAGQPLYRRLLRRADLHSLANYRNGLSALSRGSVVTGTARLAFAAALSPMRSVRRVARMIEGRRH